MIARRHVSAPGPAAIAIGGDAKGPVTATYVDTQLVLGPSSIPIAVAVKNPAVVYAAVGLDGFTGRDWLVAEVDGFIAGNPRGYVFVTANAGLGKTAFAAWLVRERGYLSHFSRYADGRSVRAALQNLSAQLVSQYGLHDQAPDGMLPDWAQTPGGFESLLGLAARVAAERGRPLVIVVDGLDEAEPVDDGLPFGLPSLLPDGVYVIGTSRTGSPPGRPDAPAVTLRIGNTDQRNIGDIRAFLRHAAGEEVLAGRLAQAGVDTGEFVDLLAERCAGVWVYLRYALQELRIGLRRPDKIGQLPAGLRDYYAAQIRRWQADPAWGTGLLPLLATLGVAGEPLPAATLARLSGGEARRLDVAAVRHWCSLTIRPLLATARRHADGQAETVYEIYHASFTEVLAGDLPAGADDEQLAEWIDLADELRQAALAAHARIVGTYLAEFGGLAMGLPTLAGSPDAAGADGGYPLRHLVRHLEQARCWADADALLAAGHSAGADRVVNSWFAAHEHADSLVSYLDDLRRAHSVAAAATDTELAASWLAPSLGREIRYALMIASMISRTMGMSPTLLIHAVKAGLWTPHRGLDQARRLGPSARVDALMGIRPYLPPAEQPGIVAEALATATAIDWGEHRASALAMLAPWLTADQRAEAIAAAAAIGTVQHRTMAVTALARQLPAAQQHEVLAAELAAVAAIGQAESRCNGLLVLAPHLPPDLLGPALDAAAGIGRGAVREHALARLAPLLPPDLLAPALAAAIDFGGDDSRPARPEGAALAALAPHLPPVLLAQALADASAIPAERQRAEALAVLAPHLPPDTLGHALAAAIAIRYEYERGQALAALAPQLSPGLFAQALAAAITITSEQFRAQALAGLAAQPPPDVLADLLAAARSITDQRHRAQVLAALAPHLPAGQREDVLAEALAAADATTHEYHRARIIADLAPHLPPGLLAQALADASTIPHEAYRARALAALAPYLPAGLLAQALAAAAVIADGRARGTALAGLAPCLRPEQLAQALAAAAEITEESPRADALQALVPHLPPDLVAQALAAAVAMAPHMYRVHVLTALAPRLSADQLAQALATASETGFVRSWALARLAPYLPPSVLADALAISTAVADADVGVRALVALASQLATAGQPGALAQILAAAMAVTSGRGHAEALTALVPSLPADERPAVIDQVLSAAAEITDEGQRADALTGLAAGLPAGQPAVLAKVVTAATEITNEQHRARALTALVPLLPPASRPPVLDQALAAASAIAIERYRARALTALAPLLPPAGRPAVIGQALRAAAADRDEHHRAETLAALVPLLPADQRRGVILAVLRARLRELEPFPSLGDRRASTQAELDLAVTDWSFRACVRDALVPSRPYRPWLDVVGDIRADPDAITDAVVIDSADSFRVHAVITTLAPLLPPDLLAEALAVAAKIPDGSHRVEALLALAPHLPVDQRRSVLAQALADTGGIGGVLAGRYRAEPLIAQLGRLPDDLIAPALAAVSAAGWQESADALIALAPRLPADLLGDAFAAASKANSKAQIAVLQRASALLRARDSAALLDMLRATIDGHDRPGCLMVLAEIASVIDQLAGPAAVCACVEAIGDVQRWWP